MLNRNRLPLLLAATALATAVAAPAQAQSIDELKAQLAALSKRIEELEKKQADADSMKEKAKKPAVVVKSEPGFGIASDDGLFELNLRGRVFVDAGWASDKDDTMDIKATEIRAARIGIDGTAWKKMSYRIEADFAGDKATLNDAYLQYKSSMGAWKMGYFKPSVSLEETTSSVVTTFMERAAFTDAFNFGRNIGVNYSNGGDNWTFNAGLFRGNNASAFDDEGYLVAVRATYGDTFDGGAWLLGGSFRLQDVGDGSAMRYRQREHVHLTDPLVATGSIATKDRFTGLEAAVQASSFHAAAEWGLLRADNAGAGGRDADFYGGYIEAGWFITGESKPLNLKKGLWDRPKVDAPVQDGGIGAWQVAGRFDRIDLTADGVYGGEQETYLLGVNWYLNRNSRLMLNLSHSSIKKAFDVAQDGSDGANSADALGLRAQVDW
ncbi:MAG: hypothetical protein EP335_10950 [Alphaproteobacteria bacterium]|nr:MAG: hypothetical protein EP335_10950 [Alphaproteobacteria bacterium]